MATPKDLWATPRYGACSTCTCGCVWICHVRMCDPLHWSYVLQVCPQVLSCNACVLCVRACGATGNTSVTAWANACEGLLARHNKANGANKASKSERACGTIVRSCERAGNTIKRIKRAMRISVSQQRTGGHPVQGARAGAVLRACGRRECGRRARMRSPQREGMCTYINTA
jgi:hypothetical protein